MIRRTILAAAFALAGIGAAQAETAMQPGQRMPLAGGMGNRVVRQVMIAPDGGGIDIVYDMPAGAPVASRVLPLENVNGMLEVIHDTEMPQTRALGSCGTPRLIAKGEGMYDVAYDK